MPADEDHASEIEKVRQAYARRAERGLDSRYSPIEPHNRFILQSRERALLDCLRSLAMGPLAGLRILDVGCGDGSLLRDFVRYGASPANLAGLDLLPERIERARQLSPELRFTLGDALNLPFDDAIFDLALAFTLLSSLTSPESRQRVASEMLRVVRPGGAVILYDFWINPLNRDVRPLRAREIRRLFAGHRVSLRRLTLAPPIARAIAGRSSLACRLLEAIPLLRTHHLAVIQRSRQ